MCGIRMVFLRLIQTIRSVRARAFGRDSGVSIALASRAQTINEKKGINSGMKLEFQSKKPTRSSIRSMAMKMNNE